jgi:mRNA-degrading endonuclease RelE of RelBE toxin-antitoxin system
MMHRNLLKNFGKLPTKVQKRVAEWIDIFQENPNDPSIGLHSLKETMIDPKVRGGALPGGYRAIIVAPDKGDTYLLVHIDAHDKAYNWAKNKHFEVHSATGVFQLFDVEETKTAVQKQAVKTDFENDYPLCRLSDDELFKIGIPQPLIPAVRAIRSDDSLEALTDYLPPDCRDVLFGVAMGMTMDEALTEMLGLVETGDTGIEGGGDFSHIGKMPNFDLVLLEGEDHLKDILKGDFQEWRIFLHPYQKKLVEWQTKGPMNINGAAGTGKTVALMHRAVFLARKLENPKAQVLLTTFTTNLSIAIKNMIHRLGPDVDERIEITNLHALARTICLRSGWRGRIAGDEDFADIWDEVLQNPNFTNLAMSREELKKEYSLVIDPNGIDEEESYLTTVRSGRPRISRKQRRSVWPIFRAFQRGLKKRNLLTFEGAIHQARLAIEQGNFQKFTHVLVDEIQDFSLEALKLIKALSPIDEGLRDPLCTAGDGHQRIYRNKIPLSRAGINIRGRSRRLKINYRTSEQIRKFAQSILQGVEIDDLDGGMAVVIGDHSAFKGPEPIIEICSNAKVEAETVVAWAKTLLESHGLATHDICVTPYKPEIISTLTAAGIKIHKLKPREDDPGSDIPGIRMGTIKRIKGLEFRAVALVCADPNDPMNKLGQAALLEKCERYVATTRAREHLLVTVSP